MSWESLFELIGLMGTLVSIFYFFMRGGRHAFTVNAAISLTIVLAVSLVKYFINAAEWSGFFDHLHLDHAEDYLDDIWPIVWFLFFFTTILDASAENIGQSEKRYRLLFNNTMDAILVFNEKGSALNCNAVAFQLTGYGEKELERITVTDILPELDPSLLIEVCSEENNQYCKRKTRLLHKNGSVLAIELSGQTVILDGQKALLVVVRDITEKQKREDELVKIEKLEALGVLAGGIAHDFNNYLMGIIGNVSILKFESKENGKIFQRLEDMEKATLRAKDMTQQLLTFAKGGEPVKILSSVGELIKDTTKFALRGSNVKAEFNIDPSLYTAEVDKGQIGQVISNLVINADQVMPDGGVINIHAQNELLSHSNRYGLIPGPYIKIVIADNGAGIPKEYISKVFDPYFSTKKRGSGLGLTVALSIIEKHQGKITVLSDRVKGTTFSFYLPASRKSLINDKQQEILFPHKRFSVLVMDDERFVRETIADMLNTMGFKVETTENGEEAVSAYRKAIEKEKPYDFVIMDLTVPGAMGGRKAIRELLKIDPKVKAVVSSGYSNKLVMSNYGEYGFKGVLQKPYSMKDLRNTLYRLIESESK